MKVLKTWTITEEIDDEGEKVLHRVNDGFTATELLGMVESIKWEIIDQMMGRIKPDRIVREVVKEEQK